MSTTFSPPRRAGRNEDELALFFIARTSASEDERLYAVAADIRVALSEQVSQMVASTLGPLFRLKAVEVRRGSVEFWVFIAGGFTLVSQYADFVRSLELLLSQIREAIRQFFRMAGYDDVVVTGGWTPTWVKKRNRFAPLRASQELIMLMLVLYLIASHAALLVVVARIALKVLLSMK